MQFGGIQETGGGKRSTPRTVAVASQEYESGRMHVRGTCRWEICRQRHLTESVGSFRLQYLVRSHIHSPGPRPVPISRICWGESPIGDRKNGLALCDSMMRATRCLMLVSEDNSGHCTNQSTRLRMLRTVSHRKEGYNDVMKSPNRMLILNSPAYI